MVEWFNDINTKNYDFSVKNKICVYVLVFLVGALAGYIYEELFVIIIDHEFVKRGFLYGPYLPVYGFGAVLMMFTLKKFKKNPLVVFLLAMLITGILEYFTGFALWKIYHKTWWDYSGLFLNINGYVCLRSVLTFGVGGLLLIYIAEPLVCKLVSIANEKLVHLWSFMICITFLVDLLFTLIYRNKI